MKMTITIHVYLARNSNEAAATPYSNTSRTRLSQAVGRAKTRSEVQLFKDPVAVHT